MRMRGSEYYRWADSQLPNLSQVEEYGASKYIDIVARLSRNGITQVFLGVYDTTGAMLFEEYNESLVDQDVSQGINWGLERAKAFVDAIEHDGLKLLRSSTS